MAFITSRTSNIAKGIAFMVGAVIFSVVKFFTGGGTGILTDVYDEVRDITIPQTAYADVPGGDGCGDGGDGCGGSDGCASGGDGSGGCCSCCDGCGASDGGCAASGACSSY
ncbi:MAG: hypothetical protein OQJ98_02930 [Candidatus Pacebacteria bacterium]|nr:hypothetical protein [Candidatus Paceibacterota bacterium]